MGNGHRESEGKARLAPTVLPIVIRILHTADLHLGVENYGRPFVPEGESDPYGHLAGLSTRLVDTLRAFDEAVDYALNNEVDLFLFCGDAYRSRDPSQTQQREFARRIARLAAGGVHVFLLVGNHDLPNAISRATSVEIFETLSVENVTVADKGGVHRIETRSGPIQMAALPWPRRSLMLSRDDYKGASIDKLNQIIEEKMSSELARQVAGLDPSIPAILGAHLRIQEARLGSERAMILGTDHVMLLSTLANPAFDYVALGHMHSRQLIDRVPPVAYPGSLQRTDFGEEGEDKGFLVLELDPSQLHGMRVKSLEFHSVAARPFLTISVNADNEDPTATVLAAIARKPVKDAIVRVHIRVSERREGLIRDTDIRNALKDAHYIAAISHEVEREHRTRLGTVVAESLTPLDALQLYLQTKKTPPERAEELLKHAEGLIQIEGG
ncbi:MAG: exonuclease SbcCD subunit D [Chloroflexota bacterium]